MTKIQHMLLLKKAKEISSAYIDKKLSHEEVYSLLWDIAVDGIDGNLYTWLMSYVMGPKEADEKFNLWLLVLIFDAATDEPEEEEEGT